MKRVMTYLAKTSDQGLTLEPNAKWDRSKSFEFEIAGFLDLDFGKDPSTGKSVSG